MNLHTHAARVVRYYDDSTLALYCSTYHSRHLHFGLFAPGECPGPDDFLPAHPGLDCALDRMVDHVVGLARLSPGRHVLDAGCGVGGTALRLAEVHRLRITGVNLNALQLGLARRAAGASPRARSVSFVRADCTAALPLRDASADAVVAFESVCHFAGRAAFFREVRRVLRPGAPVVALDWLAACPRASRAYARFIAPLSDPWALAPLEDLASYRRLLAGAGLDVELLSGFGPGVGDNVTVLGHCVRRMRARLCGLAPDHPRRRWLRMLSLLHDAWRAGAFTLVRYRARRPL